MIENIFTRLAASRRTIDPNVVRFGIRHIAFAAAILALSLCARAGTPLDSLHSPSGGMIDPKTKDESAISPVVEVPRTLLLFNLSVHGSLLYLDWKDNAEVQAIRIYDLHGRLFFAWKPASEAEIIARWVWDGRDAKGSRLERGHYLIHVQTRAGTRNQVFAWGRDR